MERTIRLTLEYDGTDYNGWQVQNASRKGGIRQKKTVQSALEAALARLFCKHIPIIGSGRTDAGVHALGQTAHFSVDSKLPLERVITGLNAFLPDDIVVVDAREETPTFHSRFSAVSKLYRYTIANRPYRLALERRYAWLCSFPLNVKRMRKEARVLQGKHDFSAFRISGSSVKSSVRTIKKIAVRKHGDRIMIDIEADGFLYAMARSIAGTLIDIGRGRLPPGSMRKILLSRKRAAAGVTAPACGLCLVCVHYS
ncbi:MAG TPA: tRNA pseudouridine(38-40) synthase TruA [Candidatus Omnitrophota bacterium]|nr:tRNA pseudouridine(38-40) synthase TruA [Candidatus Omnitrophota bacterium]HPT06564.1 tRNA pseudouridine(38-40) synthase TruA [Candidatus Omnitrophota bacterium]